jgi:hypothetical protein
MMRNTFISLLFLLPTPLLAHVSISEINYDLLGSDSDREWIEVQNSGATPIDLTKYKFLEASVKHGIIASGSSTVPAGAFAVIADNTGKFMEDNPGYVGLFFKSSFSLSNTGEVIALVDASSTVDQVSYKSTQGAAGNGLSLQKDLESWVAAKPSPGRAFLKSDLPAAAPPPPPATPTSGLKVAKATGATSSNSPTTSVVTTESPALTFAKRETNSSSPYTWWLALGAVLTLGAGATFLMRTQGGMNGISSEADQYEIVE